MQVIGIHKSAYYKRKLNMGTFIGEIFNNENIINNYIFAWMNIKQEEINKDIRIINSYEEQQRILKNGQLKINEMNEK